MNREKRAQLLTEMIEEAWSTPTYPGHDNLLNPRTIDSELIIEKFTGKHWREIYDEIQQDQDAGSVAYSSRLSFLSNQAFHYYLPAYLITSLDLYRSDVVGEFLLYNMRDLSQGKKGQAAIEQFSQQQCQAVQQFLTYIKEEYPVEDRLIMEQQIDFWTKEVHKRL